MNSKTAFYILKRILLAILTVWIVITVTFFVMHAVPGGPFLSEKAISASAQAALEAKYGLDKPLLVQYGTYLKDIVTRFDFGPSLKQRGRMVIDIIADGMKTSVKLGIIAAAIAGVFGIVLGAVAALRRNKLIDKIIMVITTAFVSMPSFIMGTLLLIFFAITLKILPANGAARGGLILPIITLSLYPMAYITRLTRSSMLDVLGQDYIRTARAKGVPQPQIIWRHALKNALNPVVTAISGWLASLLAGAVFVEYIFDWKGMGVVIVDALDKYDFPVVMGSLLYVSIILVIINIVVDIIYGWLDPRVKTAA